MLVSINIIIVRIYQFRACYCICVFIWFNFSQDIFCYSFSHSFEQFIIGGVFSGHGLIFMESILGYSVFIVISSSILRISDLSSYFFVHIFIEYTFCNFKLFSFFLNFYSNCFNSFILAEMSISLSSLFLPFWLGFTETIMSDITISSFSPNISFTNVCCSSTFGELLVDSSVVPVGYVFVSMYQLFL